ncbi:MAG: NAD-dependent succinate-semialdehyde dehydrogenase [Deltaproteobacteria bacterium]|nr:NAD-dependent succinate-semialdehyde dehydrogenase [Deltaproteobacteria bacterium]
MTMQSINPATGMIIETYNEYTREKTTAVIESVNKASSKWRDTNIANKSRFMKSAARVLRNNTDEYARLIIREMGKPIAQSRSEINKCALVCDFYAENAESFLRPEIIPTDARKSFVVFEPLGIVLGVMPWNFPFWQVFRFAAPALMAGNTCLLKHASNVPGCALAIEAIFHEAGFPENTFRTLLVKSHKVNAIIDNPAIRAVTLTGSVTAGRAVAARAGSQLKKTVMELGGSDAYVILEDADLVSAVAECIEARLVNSGQSCIAAKRFIVVRSQIMEFERLLVQGMREKRVADPLLEDTEIGPLARIDLRDELHQQVMKSIEMGAECILGGEMPEGTGAFYNLTVLTNVKKGMPAFDEELFGPVAAIIRVEDEKDAIRAANDSVFGLGAAVFTRDRERGERIATYELEAGNCFVNAFVRSDPRLPFGGIKQSGYGRELSHFGIKEFVNIKTLYVK